MRIESARVATFVTLRKVKQEKRKYASIVVLRDNLQLELGKQRYLKERMREQEERKVCLEFMLNIGLKTGQL